MDPVVTSVVGMVTGVIGAATGIAGAIMGFVAYRRSNEIKRSDRRLDLHRERNAAHVSAVGLIELLPRALGSRKAIMAAKGSYKSGAMERYETEHRADSQRAHQLAQKIPSTDTDYSSMSLDELENAIVELDRVSGWIGELTRKYEESLARDKVAQAQLHEDMRVRLRPKQ